jgi:hypothetical protein
MSTSRLIHQKPASVGNFPRSGEMIERGRSVSIFRASLPVMGVDRTKTFSRTWRGRHASIKHLLAMLQKNTADNPQGSFAASLFRE